MSYRRSDRFGEKNGEDKIRHTQSIIMSAPDRALLITVAFLVIIGFLAIFSASAPKCLEEGGNPAQFLFKQLICFVVGFIGLKFFTNYDYKKLADWSVIFGCIIIVLLILVDFTPLGVTVNGAKRWINLLGFQLQPSEFAKPAVILMLAAAMKKDADLFDQAKWTSAFIPIIIMLGLIFNQPNLSMVILLMATSVVMFLSAGGSLKLFFSCLGAGIFSLMGSTEIHLHMPEPWMWYECILYKNSYLTNIHRHSAWQLTASLLGEFLFRIPDGGEVLIRPGDWILLSPELLHDVGSDSPRSRAMQIFFRRFPPDQLPEPAERFNLRRGIFRTGHAPPEEFERIARAFLVNAADDAATEIEPVL